MNVREHLWGVEPTKGRRRAVKASRMLGSTRKPARGEQLSLANTKTWGGPRANSGRKAGLRPKVRHRARDAHRQCDPVHVTMRRAKGVPSLRVDRMLRLVRQAIRDTRRDGFRIVHYSVQADHLHLLIEADDAMTLTSGMRSFSVRVAARVNRDVLGRKRGHVWGDRHHRRELSSPSEVRRALVYVLNNHLKHGEWDVGLIDPCSSAPWFDGWMHQREPVPPEPSVAQPPSTWLLETGWSTVGWAFSMSARSRAAREQRGYASRQSWRNGRDSSAVTRMPRAWRPPRARSEPPSPHCSSALSTRGQRA